MKKKAMIAMTTLGLTFSSVMINVPLTQPVVYADTADDLEQQLIEFNTIYLDLETVFNNVSDFENVQYLGRYVEMYLLQEGIKLQEKVLQHKAQEEVRLRFQYDLGLISLQDYVKASKDIDRLKVDLQKDKDQLAVDIEKLFRQMNVYDKDDDRRVVLTGFSDVEFGEIKKVEQPDEWEISSKVANSRAIILSERTIVLNQFIQLYFDLNQAYESVKRAEQDIEFAREDYHQVRVNFRLGLVSKFDYEQAALSLEQADFNLMQAKVMYYMIQQQIEEL